MKISGAIFDMDGTLVDSLMLWEILWEAFGKKFCGGRPFSPSEEDDKAVRTLPLKNAMELLFEHYSIGESGEELLRVANEIIEEFYANSVQLKPGVREFLEDCVAKGVKMCIASATSPGLIRVALRHCGIAQYFSKIFSCGVLGKGKDVPDIYWMALDFLGTKQEETWVVEDSLVALETAHRAGFPTVGIYDRYNFGQEKIKNIVTEYIAPGETLERLLD